jgi:N-acetyl-gamma-glutamyl-phosphate reductase
MKKIKVGILGASSYTGLELLRMLSGHPYTEIAFISSQSHAGQRFCTVFPEMMGIFDGTFIAPDRTSEENIDCIFSCLPHAVSASFLGPFIAKGVRVIDLSADFRITDADVYQKWYKTPHPSPALLKDAVFGLPEHYREKIANARILANPGCYPTSILLPLLPLLKEKLMDPGAPIIADSKSGVSGAGRTLKLTSHFVEVYEDVSAYSVGRSHRHIAEIDQELSLAAGIDIKILFSPHLMPVNRGILSTIYFSGTKSAVDCLACLKAFYDREPFVRVRQADDLPHIKYVAHTNFCDITITGGKDGTPLVAVSVIDNLIKGASGQALQNMNIMFGFEETTALPR